MLKSKFSMLLDDMRNFVEKRNEINGKIADLNQNGSKIYSQEKIESDIAVLKEKLLTYAKDKMNAAEKTIASIREEMENMSFTLNMAELQPVFSYLQAAGEKASRNIVETQVARFAGNADAIQTLYEAAQNSGCNSEVVNVIKTYFVDTEKAENDLQKACYDVYNAGGSGADGGRRIANVSKHCGAPVENNIVDVEADTYIVRKALGLAN